MRRVTTLWLVAGSLLSEIGCRSTDPTPSGGFASVVISGNTPGQIRDVAVQVFTDNGYVATQKDPANLVFEKQASRMSNLVYGSLLGETPVWIRVKAAIVTIGEMRCRLQCRAYLVQDRGSVTEEEQTRSRLRKGEYQKLLDEVAKRFAVK